MERLIFGKKNLKIKGVNYVSLDKQSFLYLVNIFKSTSLPNATLEFDMNSYYLEGHEGLLLEYQKEIYLN